jgi:EAL domain-containing protein (putative c-di-GMP-specific phosphodiesterase class I)
VSVAGRGTAETLLHEADTAMYRAKSLGGGRAEMFDAALGRQAVQRARAQRTLDSALDERRVVIHFQPVVELRSGRVAGFEALARITERDGTILPPADFIPVAEDSGLVVPLGAQVLALACRDARSWEPPNLEDRGLTVAVNLSPRQFGPGDLTEVVERTLARAGLPASCLHLELTETAIMDLHPDILRQLERIRDLGVEMGLDDFGTGYASLTHLRRLPLSFVKIDQSFVQGLGIDDEDERIVAAVVDLAANLGLRSIAEGVETPSQRDRLRDLGCDQAQGFLFGRPMPGSQVPAAVGGPTD